MPIKSHVPSPPPLLLLMGVGLAASLPDFTQAASLADLASQVNEEEMSLTVEELTGLRSIQIDGTETWLTSRNVFHPLIQDAAAYVENRFWDLGLTTWDFPFTCREVPDLRNIVAELPGTGTGPPLLLTAHYDSIASRSEGWEATADPAPGADDDGSGVALLFEVGRLLSEVDLHGPVWLVAFSCEEYSLTGSTVQAAALADEGVEILGMASFDPVGYNGWAGSGEEPYLWFSHDDLSTSFATSWVEVWTPLVPGYRPTAVHEDLIGGDSRSDHHGFQEEGYVAVHAGGYPQPPSYHTVDDVYAVVDFAYAAAFVRGALALVDQQVGWKVEETPSDDDDSTTAPDDDGSDDDTTSEPGADDDSQEPEGCGGCGGRGGSEGGTGALALAIVVVLSRIRRRS